MIVKVFSTPVCPYCHTLKEFLKSKGIVFDDIDVSADEKMRDDMIQKSGQMGVPVVYIDDQVVIGFDREKILNLLGVKE
jgi:glutaredoxin 3